MAIKQHANKSSVQKPKTRYIQGGTTDVYKKRLGWWERDITIEKNQITDIEVIIDSKYQNRPDIIAYEYYGDPTLAWIILQYNNIIDTKEELISGKVITIPSRDRVYFDIMINPIIIQESKL